MFHVVISPKKPYAKCYYNTVLLLKPGSPTQTYKCRNLPGFQRSKVT